MSRPLPGPEPRAVAEALTAALGRACFDHMRAAMGPTVRVRPWRELSDAGRACYGRRLEWLIPSLLPYVASPFVVGARDTLDGRLGNCCLVAAGQFECTRAPHIDELHATGDGVRITAVWTGAL